MVIVIEEASVRQLGRTEETWIRYKYNGRKDLEFANFWEEEKNSSRWALQRIVWAVRLESWAWRIWGFLHSFGSPESLWKLILKLRFGTSLASGGSSWSFGWWWRGHRRRAWGYKWVAWSGFSACISRTCHWRAQSRWKQHAISTSITEAEYIALCSAAKQVKWQLARQRFHLPWPRLGSEVRCGLKEAIDVVLLIVDLDSLQPA